MSSAVCSRPASPTRLTAQCPPIVGRTLRRLRTAAVPPRATALLRLFARLDLLRRQQRQLRLLVRRARRLTPRVADRVAALALSDPDAALEVFVAAFQSVHVALDELVSQEGFEHWAEVAGDRIPLMVRGHDRCNGLESLGYRPGYALLWALIQDVFWDDQRSELIAEIAGTFGENLADRLDAATPPEHRVLCRRLARSPYASLAAFSRWVLGDVRNELLLYPAHHADELVIPWTRRGVARAAHLVRQADAFEAPILALARWLEHAPEAHGPLLVDAALGLPGAAAWTRAAIRPCLNCGFPPTSRNWQEATDPQLLPTSSPHPRRRSAYDTLREDQLYDDDPDPDPAYCPTLPALAGRSEVCLAPCAPGPVADRPGAVTRVRAGHPAAGAGVLS